MKREINCCEKLVWRLFTHEWRSGLLSVAYYDW